MTLRALGALGSLGETRSPSATPAGRHPAAAARWLLTDPDAARRMGRAAREHALCRFGLKRFLADWDDVLEEVA